MPQTNITNVTSSGIAIGSIHPHGGSSAPTGFLLCQGQAISRTTFAALFAVIGTTYGIGDGSTTFNVPNLQGVFPRGAGSQTISAITYTGTLGSAQGDTMQGHHQGVTDGGHNHTQNSHTHTDSGHSHGPQAGQEGFMCISAGSNNLTVGGGSNQFNEDVSTTGTATAAISTTTATNNATTTGITTSGPITDGTNGTPRVGAETRPANVGVNYIIAYV